MTYILFYVYVYIYIYIYICVCVCVCVCMSTFYFTTQIFAHRVKTGVFGFHKLSSPCQSDRPSTYVSTRISATLASRFFVKRRFWDLK